MSKTFYKNIRREVRSSISRFIAIFAISALGAGFYAGLKATTPDMFDTADKYYSDTRLMDYKLMSTYGVTNDDISAFGDLDFVQAVMPAYTVDLMTSNGDKSAIARIHSLPADTGGDNPAYLNHLILKEGRFPENKNECIADSASGHKIGDKILIGDNNSEDSLDMISVREFTVVGRAESPQYISFTRGNTNIGSGAIDFFLYVGEDAFDVEFYTDAYILAENTAGLSAFSDEYGDVTKQGVKDLEALAETRKDIRYKEIQDEIGEELEDAQKELDDAKKEADEKLSEALQKIEDGEKELEENRQKISDAEKDIRDGEKKLADGRKEFEDNKKKLADSEASLSEGEAEYQKQLDSYNEGYNSYLSFKQGADSLNGYSSALAGQVQLLGSQLQNNDFAGFSETADSAIATASGISSALKQLGVGTQELDGAIAEMGSALAEMRFMDFATAAGTASYITNLSMEGINSQLAETQAALAEGKARLDEGRSQLNAVWGQIGEGHRLLNEAEAEIAKNEKKLRDAKAELEDGKQKLEDGEIELEDGKKEYEEKKVEAEEKINDAQKKINDGKKELADLEEPEWFVWDRNKNSGYSGFENDAGRIGLIATVVPVFFFFVAALVCLTTMTRMVEEQRTEIGTFKALGFSKGQIAFKYMSYAAMVSAGGGLFGIALSLYVFPKTIWGAYSIMYIMPPLVLGIQPLYSISALAAIVASVCAATLWACINELRSVPAQLMRPKSPKAGSRVFLERINFIWKRMSFSQKVTVRNLFRYKKRLFMTLFGVLGCTALLLTGFGLKDSIGGIVIAQYDEISHYDISVYLSENSNSSAGTELNSLAKSFNNSLYVYEATVEADANGKNNNGMTTSLYVPENAEEIEKFMTFRERKSGRLIEFPSAAADGEIPEVIISEKLASRLDVKKGGIFTINLPNEAAYTVRAGGIAENYVMHFIYMNKEDYTSLFKKDIEYTNMFVSVDTEDESQTLTEIIACDNVAGAVSTQQTKDVVHDLLEGLNAIVYLIIACAGALAIIVLYNLTNINITERVRELATLRVLGFHNREVANYIYRENIIVTLIATLTGLVGGVYLHRFVILVAEVDEFMFIRAIQPLSFILAALFTIVCALIVDIIMLKKIRHIDMVESLKSAE